MRSMILFCLLIGNAPWVGANTLLILGDSLSAAYGIKDDEGWVAQLQAQRPDLTIVNASISGETSSGGRSRLPALLDRHQPDAVLIELGANDGLRGLSLAALRENLDDMIDRSEAAGARVGLLGIFLPPNYGPYSQQFADTLSSTATAWSIPFAPCFICEAAGDESLMQPDRIHPNAEAQPLLLQAALPIIETLLDAQSNAAP